MPPALARNHYLVTPSGRDVGSRVPATLLSFGGLFGSIAFGVVGVTVGAALDSAALALIALGLGSVGFLVTVVSMWVWLLTGAKAVQRAAEALRGGDVRTAVTLCQKPLFTVFRADVRTRALYVLGLAAEASSDFAEADDLFARATRAMPAMAASKYQRHARCLMLCHRAIALVATHRLDEADALVREASALFPPQQSTGLLDVLGDDAAFGVVGVSTALRDIEQGRDPRALLSLACAVVLSARGMAREALELVDRERVALSTGLSPRELRLLANVEARARGLMAGGPMRAPGLAVAAGAGDPWADRVLPLQA